jgi:hypothetical protein
MRDTHTSRTKAGSPTLISAVACGLFGLLPCDLSAQGQTLEYKIIPDDAVSGEFAGNSVAVGDGIAVVGSHRADVGATDSGAVYVFEFDGNSWNQTAKLATRDPGFTDHFGSAVAVGPDGTIVIGAAGKDSGRGATYVFEKRAGMWTRTAMLIASDGRAGDQFGFATDIDGDTLLVGASGRNSVSGAAYVFERSEGAWRETAILVSTDIADGDNFGYSVSVEGGTALVGSPTDDDRAANSGSAYVFTRDNGAWSQAAKLTASDAADGDLFALSGSVSNGTIVIGARGDDDERLPIGASGQVHVGRIDVDARDCRRVLGTCNAGKGRHGDHDGRHQ